jgi:hypothetical protein
VDQGEVRENLEIFEAHVEIGRVQKSQLDVVKIRLYDVRKKKLT